MSVGRAAVDEELGGDAANDDDDDTYEATDGVRHCAILASPPSRPPPLRPTRADPNAEQQPPLPVQCRRSVCPKSAELLSVFSSNRFLLARSLARSRC